MTHGQTGTGWTVDDSTFGARLALVRLRMDWNLKEAAKECALPAASWRTWERDGVSPRRIVEIARLISLRTGCSYLWLLTGSVSGGESRPVTHAYPTMTPRTVARPPNRPAHGTPDGRRDQRRPELLRKMVA
jgi:hypothetical protein